MMISVVVTTYNAKWQKLQLTLLSIIKQKNVDVEIVITDDASKEFPEKEINDFFSHYGFSNYKLRKSSINKGTVNNVYGGCEYAEGEYIKLLSPGDCLFDDDTLYKWHKYMMMNDISISFGNPIHYQFINGNITIIRTPNLPRIHKVYEKSINIDSQRLNYLLLGDVANGASFLVRRSLFLRYLCCLHNKIIYAEDLAYKLMVLEGVPLHHYLENVVWYESGTGISWQSSFNQKIDADGEMLNEIIMSSNYEENDFAQKYQRYLKHVITKKNKTLKRLIRLKYFPKVLYWEEYRKINKLYTATNVDIYMLKKLLDEVESIKGENGLCK